MIFRPIHLLYFVTHGAAYYQPISKQLCCDEVIHEVGSTILEVHRFQDEREVIGTR